MAPGSKIFIPCRSMGYVSNHIPLRVRYIKSRKENLIVTCVGKSFHTYGISHFGLLSVGGLHPGDISCMTSDAFHVYTACNSVIYAWRRGTELQHEYRGHSKPICLMVPFGAHLISIDKSSKVIVWDIKSERVFLELKFDKSFNISAVLHPSTYINKILLASDCGQMQLWNINTSKLIYSFKGWKGSITCLEQAPAIDVVAIGMNNGRIILHNLKFDEAIMEFTQDWGTVTSISFRSDGVPIMATGSMSGHVVFWDLEERKVANQLFCAHSGAVTGLCCLPNEPLILTSSPDNTLKLWIFDMPDGGARLLRLREGHSATPNFVRFHGLNGYNILSASGDSTLRIFNTQTEQFNKSLGKASYNRKVSKKRGRTIEDPLIMPPIIQFTSETTREKEWDNIAAIHSGLLLVTTWSYDKVKMGELKLLPERFHKKNIDINLEVIATCLCLTHCGNFVIIGYSTGHVDRFNIQSGQWRDSYGHPKAHNSAVHGITNDSLNRLTITGSSDRHIKFWNFKCKSLPALTILLLDEPINFFRCHSESSMFVAALEDFTLDIIDVETRQTIRKFTGHTGQVTDAAFSPDARWLITSSMDCSIKIWDVPTGQLVDHFATDAACISLDMSPTGESLITAHVDMLGLFLWTNKSLYTNVTLKSVDPNEEPSLVELPEIRREFKEEDEEIKVENEDFISQEQISSELVTLSGLPSSRWQNLLNIDVIRKKNKPKSLPKAPRSAPFFLPTQSNISGFNFELNNADSSSKSTSKLLLLESMENLSEFGRILKKTVETNEFNAAIEKLSNCGPSMIDFEIKSLAPEGGGSIELMCQFLKCLESILLSNRDFELAAAYLGVFLKSHATTIAQETKLVGAVINIQSVHNIAWERLQNVFLYNMCIVRNLKTM